MDYKPWKNGPVMKVYYSKTSCKKASRIEYSARGSFVCMQPAASYMSETLAIPHTLKKGVVASR